MLRYASSTPFTRSPVRQLPAVLRRMLGQVVEPVDVQRRRYGYQPAVFRWRGAIYRIYAVEAVWDQAARGQRPARRFFRVQCAGAQSYTLYHDLQVNTWHLVS